jgi:hypothetical protein
MDEFVRMTGTSLGNRYVISDIHGCIKTFRQLVENAIKFNKSDQLFLLGRLCGSRSIHQAVLDYIIVLIESGYHMLYFGLRLTLNINIHFCS